MACVRMRCACACVRACIWARARAQASERARAWVRRGVLVACPVFRWRFLTFGQVRVVLFGGQKTVLDLQQAGTSKAHTHPTLPYSNALRAHYVESWARPCHICTGTDQCSRTVWKPTVRQCGTTGSALTLSQGKALHAAQHTQVARQLNGRGGKTNLWGLVPEAICAVGVSAQCCTVLISDCRSVPLPNREQRYSPVACDVRPQWQASAYDSEDDRQRTVIAFTVYCAQLISP